MCFKVKAPTISTTGRDLIPSTSSTEPEAPALGDTDEDVNRAKGKKSLRIPSASSTSTSRASGLNL